MLPAVPVTLSADDLHRLIPDIRSPFPYLADCLERLLDEVREAEDGGRVAVPDFAERFDLDVMVDPVLAAATKHQRNSVTALALLAGKTVTVRRDRPGLHTMLDYEDVIPSDLVPMVITDASGRVRATYDHWARGRGNLLTLRSAQKRYEPLTVHLWKRGGGKSSFRRDGLEIASEIAAVINQKPHEPWLVVHHKATGVLDVEDDVRSRLDDPLTQVHFLHWGNHQATNAFVKVPNVILAGTLFFPPSHYEALGRASAGIDAADDFLPEAYDEIVQGEHRHVILQAICRGAVRACQGDVCAPCHAYVIASGRSRIADELRTVFPGCKVVAWTPRTEKLPGKVGQALDYITDRLDTEPEALVPFRDVMDAIGMADRSNFRKVVRKDHRFIDRLQSLSIFEGPDLGRARGFVRVDHSDGLRMLQEEDERNGDF